MRKILAAGALLALPLSMVGAVAFSGVAGAASTTPVTCTKLAGNFLTGTTGTVSACSDTAATGGTGTFPIAALESGSGTITWAVKKSSTSLDNIMFAEADPTVGKCPASDVEFAVTGSVSGSKGAAKKTIPAGWAFTAYACYNGTTGGLTEAKKAPFTLKPAG